MPLDLYKELSQKAAEAIAEQIREKPNSCLGLPTGNSPLGCYELLGQWTEAGKLDWNKVKCFALDDYINAPDRMSFQTYLERRLYKPICLPEENRFNPRFVDDYDELIEKAGGLDLTLLGLGVNGHIAFNEPYTPFLSWTHCIFLTESTRNANEAYYEENTEVPKLAMTMGISTILRSKKIILLVSGKHKEQVLTRALSGTADPEIPASYLSLHPNVHVLTDFPFALPAKTH